MCCWGLPESRRAAVRASVRIVETPAAEAETLSSMRPGQAGWSVLTYLVWPASFLALALRPRRWSDAGGRLTPGDAPTFHRTFQVILHWTRGPLAFAMVGPGPPPSSQLSARCEGGGRRRRHREALHQPRGFRGTDLSVVLSNLACFSFRRQFCGSNSRLKGV